MRTWLSRSVRESSLLVTLAITVIALGAFVARDLRGLTEDSDQLYDGLSQGLTFIGELEFGAQEVRRILLYALHTPDANLQLQYIDQSRVADARVHALLDSRSPLLVSPFTRASLELVVSRWQQYLVARDEEIGLLLESGPARSVAFDEHEGLARFNQLREAIAALRTGLSSEAAVRAQEARASAESATLRLVLMVLSALVAAGIGGYRISRQAALERLVRSEAHKSSILEAVPDPIISTDAAGRVIEINKAAERVFGITRGDALGADIDGLILAPPSRGALEAIVRRSPPLSTDIPPRIEAVGARRGGGPFPMEVAVVTHIAAGERVWTVHVSDLTGRRQVEQELRSAMQAAEAADQAKSDFLATMSHEIRTPLHGVIGTADLLNRTNLPTEQRELVRMLRSSATTLHDVVSDILDYSRIEAGAIDLLPVTFSLRACIQEALDPVTEPALRKGLDLGYAISDSVPDSIVADEQRVRQVLLNLLSNAVKFTDHGEVAVRVTAEDAGEDVVTIVAAVCDSGRGIPEHLHDRLFQRFSQLDNGTGTQKGGTGLGLAISRHLSHMLGGGVAVSSTDGGGSRFTFRFSARRDASHAPSDERSLAGVRVLAMVAPGIIGDQIRTSLARWGADWQLATDPGCEHGPTPVIVADADAFGFDAARLRARAGAIAPNPAPIVAVTRVHTRLDQQFPPPDRVVPKPVRAEVLHAAIAAAAGRPDADDRAARPAPAVALGQESMAILLVEDNSDNRRVAQLMLEELGLHVDQAANGFEAIELAARRKYDVILMDTRMPGIDGLETTRRIRRAGASAASVIIALTANAMRSDEARCREAGMDGYLPKPLRVETLAAALEAAVRQGLS